jgi:uncharacterized protein
MNTSLCTPLAPLKALRAVSKLGKRHSGMERAASHLGAALIALGLLGLSLTSHAQTDAAGEPQTNLQRIKIGAGMHQIDAQVALSPEQRQIGLMWRKAMPTHEGMLFIFEQASPQCFWMKNTLIPLTAAFVADDGTVVNLEDMKPQTTESHCSAKPVRYVLEMNKGWFAKKGIKAGSQLTGEPFVQTKR